MTKSTKWLALCAAAVALGACSDSAVTDPMARAVTAGADHLTSVQLGRGAGAAQGPGTAGSPISYPMYVGGGGSGTGTLVGHITVSSSVSGNLATINVGYSLFSGCLTETHLDIELQVADVPQHNGNPTPGQFGQSHTFVCNTTDSYSVQINLGTDAGVVIAAHAVVSGAGGTPGSPAASYVSGTVGLTSTLTGRRSGNVSGFTAENQPLVLANTPGNLWDSVISADPSGNGLTLENAGAKWLWESAAPTDGDAVVGSVIQASVSATVPLATTGRFLITCDNGYRVDFKGSTITTADGASAGYTTSLSTAFAAAIATNTNLFQVNVNGDGWETVESYPVTLTQGVNTFTVYGVNEHMDTGDPHTGFPGFGAGSPPIGFRAAADDPHGTPTLNPAGCIYGLFTDAVPGVPGNTSGTGWGAPNDFTGATTGTTNQGGNFSGKNWATWIAYRVR